MIQLLTTPIDGRTKPEDLEKIRRNIVEAISELQKQPLAFARLITDVELADGVDTPVPHGLGRRARVLVSPVRSAVGSGRVEEVIGSTFSPMQFVVIRATGFGSTVTVDVAAL